MPAFQTLSLDAEEPGTSTSYAEPRRCLTFSVPTALMVMVTVMFASFLSAITLAASTRSLPPTPSASPTPYLSPASPVTPSLSVGPACSLGFRAVTNALGAKSPRSATHERDALAQCWTCSLGFCATINALFGAESPGGATHERSPQGTYLAGLANHQLLFVVGQSYSGTTATFSLVASSPQVGTLCSAGTWVCEDTMLFIRAGVFSDAGRWNPMTGQDEKWLRGLDKLTHVWDLRQPVCIPSVYVYTSRCVPFRSRTLTGHTHDCRFSLTRVRPTLLACIPSRGQRVASPFQHSLSCSPARRFPSMPNTDGMRINGV